MGPGGDDPRAVLPKAPVIAGPLPMAEARKRRRGCRRASPTGTGLVDQPTAASTGAGPYAEPNSAIGV